LWYVPYMGVVAVVLRDRLGVSTAFWLKHMKLQIFFVLDLGVLEFHKLLSPELLLSNTNSECSGNAANTYL